MRAPRTTIIFRDRALRARVAGLLVAAWGAWGAWGAVGQTPPAVEPPAPAKTETPPALEAYQGRPIRRIELVVPGTRTREAPSPPSKPLDAALEQLVRNQLRLREGAAFDAGLVSEDIARLNRLGRFRSIESQVALLSDGSVELAYLLVPRTTITAVQTVGNRLLTDEDLAKQIDVLVGTPVESTQLDRAARRIEDLYRDAGYMNALVTVDQKELEESGVVLFRVREGERTRITQIRFQGNNNVTTKELRGAIQTEEWGIFDEGQVDLERLNDDMAALLRLYKDRGHIDVRASYTITPSPDAREAIVDFLVEEGPVYTLRDVKIAYDEGSQRIFTPEQLVGLMALKPGDVLATAGLRRSVEDVREAYGRLGFVDAKVAAHELRAGDSPRVDLLLEVSEGQRFRTGLIEVIGNHLTRDRVVRRMITLKPERPLDATAAKETEKRIAGRNLFDPTSVKVAIQPEKPEDPGSRDVIVEVGETNTGSFNVGAQIGSDGGIAGIIQLQQRNFDVTDTPDTWSEFFSGEAFRGGGQTFDITLAPGDQTRNLSVGLTEPSLLESDFSGSARVYLNQRLFDEYDETRYGTRLTLGRRFGSRWSVSVPLRLENVDLSDIDSDAPVDYFEVEDSHFANSLGISLSRTTADRTVFPTKGTKLQVGVEQDGLLGDFSYTKLTAEAAQYFELERDVLGRSTTLLARVEVGYIPGEEDIAPFYDRFYLGGKNLRGFAFRGASPVGINSAGVETDDPVGGNWSFFAGMELSRPFFTSDSQVVDKLAGVLFLDTGTVERDVGFDEYRVSVGVGLRIALPQLSAVPLELDFGFPIVKEDTDDERLFTFSIDLPFN